MALRRLLALARTAGDPSAGTTPGWIKLPGALLELGTTGFVIALQTNRELPPYLLSDPDGRPLASGFQLQALKEYAETHARDRAEFQP